MGVLLCSHGQPVERCQVRHTTWRHCPEHLTGWDSTVHEGCFMPDCDAQPQLGDARIEATGRAPADMGLAR